MPSPDSPDQPTSTTPDGEALTAKRPGYKRPPKATTPSPSSTAAPAAPAASEQLAAEAERPGLVGNLRARANRARANSHARAVRAQFELTEGGSSSRASSDTVRNVTKLVYVLVRGGTQFGDKFTRRRFPGLKLAATAGEARDIARPMARMIARRVDWTGDTSDAMDGLFLLFALAGFVAERTGIDLDNIQGDPGWDAELHNQIEQEVRATRRRARRPGARRDPVGTEAQQGGTTAGPDFEPTPPAAPQSAPAQAGDVPAGPVLLADRLIAATKEQAET